MKSSLSISSFRLLAFAIGVFLDSDGSLHSDAWVAPAVSLGPKNAATAITADDRTTMTKPTALFYSSEFEFDRSNSTNSVPTDSSSVVERLKINGVSVSPKGFHVLLESTSGGRGRTSNPKTADVKEQHHEKSGENVSGDVLPLKMTNNPDDAYAATSPESLTLCQLLSGVDMGGAILPPEILGKLVICHVEDKLESLYDYDDDEEDEDDETANAVFTPALSPVESKFWEYLKNQEALMREQNLFDSKKTQEKASSYKTQLPQITLDQLTLQPLSQSDDGASDEPTWQCKLECALPEWKERIVVDVQSDVMASLAYNYDPESSPLFTCIALALRYKAPIVLKDERTTPPPNDAGTPGTGSTKTGAYWSSPDDLNREFPQRTTLASLNEQSTRVTQNIERGFEIHKLTGALQIAQRLGDTRAAAKIRAKLDEYDSMEDLPTLRPKDDASATSGDRLDDPEQNILQ